MACEGKAVEGDIEGGVGDMKDKELIQALEKALSDIGYHTHADGRADEGPALDRIHGIVKRMQEGPISDWRKANGIWPWYGATVEDAKELGLCE